MIVTMLRFFSDIQITPYEIGVIILPTLKVKKLRLGEAKGPVQGEPARKQWQSRDWHPILNSSTSRSLGGTD